MPIRLTPARPESIVTPRPNCYLRRMRANIAGMMIKSTLVVAILLLSGACTTPPELRLANECSALMKAKDNNGAIQKCSEAIKINPNYEWAYSTRCLAYGRTKQYNLGIKDCEMAMEIKPTDAIAHANRCWQLQLTDRLDDALQACNHALQLGYQFGTAVLGSGDNLWQTGRQQACD